jgi:hypothetical protein
MLTPLIIPQSQNPLICIRIHNFSTLFSPFHCHCKDTARLQQRHQQQGRQQKLGYYSTSARMSATAGTIAEPRTPATAVKYQAVTKSIAGIQGAKEPGIAKSTVISKCYSAELRKRHGLGESRGPDRRPAHLSRKGAGKIRYVL